MDLYHEIMGADRVFTGDLPQIAMQSFNYDRKRAQHVYDRYVTATY